MSSPAPEAGGSLEGRGEPAASMPWPQAEGAALSLHLPPFSHMKARLFTLDAGKVGPCYPLLLDPCPERPT